MSKVEVSKYPENMKQVYVNNHKKKLISKTHAKLIFQVKFISKTHVELIFQVKLISKTHAKLIFQVKFISKLMQK